MFMPNTNFTKNTRKVFLGFALLGSILLTACSPSGANDEALSAPAPPLPPTNVSSEASAKGVINLTSTVFDFDKQSYVKAKTDEAKVLLGSGVITESHEGENPSSVAYVPYSGTDGSWKKDIGYKADTVELMRWKGKSYIVAVGTLTSATAASGLQNEKSSSSEKVSVLDAIDGNIVSTFDSPSVDTSSSTGSFLFNSQKNNDSLDDKIGQAFMTGLVLNDGSGKILVDPLTKATIATASLDGLPQSNNETAFLSRFVNDQSDVQILETFGNYALVEKQVSISNARTGSSPTTYTYDLVDTINNKTISSTGCKKYTGANGSGQGPATIYSPDFRYVTFAGNVSFDTQSNSLFCAIPEANDTRQVSVATMDNKGTLYLNGGSEILTMNISDHAKVDVLFKEIGGNSKFKITDNGDAVFIVGNTDGVAVLVPAKK